VVAFVGIDLSVIVSRSVVTQPADSRERDDHPMTWEQFTDVLPILTLALGYAGSQFSDRLRERHERDPGGRVSFVCWHDAAVNEWMLVPSTAALAHVPPPDPAVFETLNTFEFADTTRVTDSLTQAGFIDIAFTSIEQPLLFGGPGTLEDAVEFFRDGSFGTTLLAGADPTQVEHALAAVTDAFSSRLTSAGVALGATAWLVTASIPWSCPLTSQLGPISRRTTARDLADR
jgi:hypothetical protein